MVLDVLATEMKWENEVKGLQIRKEEIKLSSFADDAIMYKNHLELIN